MIQAYDARLRHLERKSMEAEMEAAKEEESEKDGRIQRQRLGLDRFISAIMCWAWNLLALEDLTLTIDEMPVGRHTTWHETVLYSCL